MEPDWVNGHDDDEGAPALPSWRGQCPDRVMPGQQHNNLYTNRNITLLI